MKFSKGSTSSGKVFDIASIEDPVLKQKIEANNKRWSLYTKIGVILAALVCLGVILIIIFTLIVPYVQKNDKYDEFDEQCSGLHESYDASGSSKLGTYKKYAVAADSAHCSTIGADILKMNGSAVDAAIATGLCNSIHHSQSSGIGGGHFMVIFLKNATYAIDAREAAPKNSFKDMFKNKTSQYGGLATAIPGEVYGYWEAHKLGGKLPWKTLFEPSIKMCRYGFPIGSKLAYAIKAEAKYIKKNSGLSEIFMNPTTNEILKENDTIRMTKLARTLELISEQNIDVFYNGTLTQIMVNEINQNGGDVIVKDFNDYKALVKRPIKVRIDNEYSILTQPLPSSGILVSFILRLMSEFKINSETLSSAKSVGLYYHRMLEVFKHTYYERSLLGDQNIENMTAIENKLLDQDFIDEIRKKIKDEKTFPSSYYGDSIGKETPGTTHISVLANGEAVGLTSTVNLYFGAKYAGNITGIIYNNEMDDFSSPGVTNFFGLKPSIPNYIKPGKRPMSSMSPIIILDNNNNVRLVLGASGGSRIISAVAQTAAENLWINPNIKDCIDHKRVHHQLYPEEAELEKGADKELRNALRGYGHKMKCALANSIVQGITQFDDGRIEANCDYRKGGSPDGV